MEKNVYKTNKFHYLIIIATFIIALIVVYNFRNNIFNPYRGFWWIYISALNFWYLFYKLVVSFFYRPQKKKKPEKILLSIDDMLAGKYEDKSIPTYKKISAVLPCYNEGKESVLKAIECLVMQDYKLSEIIFVDDGSPDVTTYKALKAMAEKHNGEYKGVKLIVHRLHKNSGKKRALVWGFLNATGDYILSVDSDGDLFPNTVSELMKPFEKDEKVGSTVGFIGVRNAKTNFLARMQEMNYYSAFNVGRASQSVFNSVIVCSGALSMHRKNLILEHLDEFMQERVFGLTCVSGDDRCLTFISRKYGYKTVYQASAVCVTEVPENCKQFIKQQSRWLRSSMLYSLQNLKYIWKFPLYAIQSFLEGYLWFICLIINICLAIFHPGLFVLNTQVIIAAIIFYVLSSYLGKIHYSVKNPIQYLLSPIYSLCYVVLTFIIRAKTVIGLPRRDAWGTR